LLDLVLIGGILIDGTGASPRQADVGVIGERVAVLGQLRQRETKRAIDVSGMYVTPGFIDIHAHSDLTLLVDPRAASKVRQGVTSEISGQCGVSAAPLAGHARDELRSWAARYGLEPGWNSLAEYLATIERHGTALNFGTLVGHGNVRQMVMGDDDRPALVQETQTMSEILTRGLQEGALGLSSGLFYAPGSYADVTELSALAQVVAAYGAYYASHIRNEGRRLETALHEAMEVGRRSGARVQISHLKLASRAHWGEAKQVLAQLETARAEGLDLGWDQYPYAAAATSLDAVVPPAFHAGGTTALLQRLRTEEGRTQIAEALADEDSSWENLAIDPGWEDITLSFHPSRQDLQGKTIAQIAASSNCPPLETALDLIVETEAQAEIVIHCMDERDVATILSHPCTMVSSDAEAAAADGPLAEGKPHPRTYGTFPRILGRYVREQGLLTWEEAIHKMTGLPAARLRLHDRGVVRGGAFADLVVFDPQTITDTATYDDPHRYPEGVRHVLVNGHLVVHEGCQTEERPGRVLRRSGSAKD
jgi:N-acyl-D-amino-acid deacylase